MSSSIICLPEEIIFMILKYNNIRDIIHFSATCKLFNQIVKNSDYLWKYKFKETLPDICINEIENDGYWFKNIIEFTKLKQQIYFEINLMSHKHFGKIGEIELNDASSFYELACTNSVSYFYTIYILQDIIKKAMKTLEQYQGSKPFTLTEMHYAKAVLRYLIHCYLAIKWVRSYNVGEIQPEFVVNFFIQWIDTTHLHFDMDIEEKLQDLTNRAKMILDKSYSTSTHFGNRTHNENQILAAVSKVLFQELQLTTTSSANLSTMDIIKVLHNKCCHPLVALILFQAVAKRCGVECELIVFPNHSFLEWRGNRGQSDAFVVQIATGELQPRKRCPFAHGNREIRYRYSSNSLLQILHTSFCRSVGPLKTYETQNSADLLSFLGGRFEPNIDNTYKIFYYCLHRNPEIMTLDKIINVKRLTETERKIILSLSSIQCTEMHYRNFPVKKHHSSVKYGVGMICTHMEHGYECVILGWDVECDPEWKSRIPTTGLSFGHKQPYYYVLAADQSERYVAEENLIVSMQPSRQYHLEELIAKDFAYFDGFSYVMNEQKKNKYPDEEPIVDVFRQRYRAT